MQASKLTVALQASGIGECDRIERQLAYPGQLAVALEVSGVTLVDGDQIGDSIHLKGGDNIGFIEGAYRPGLYVDRTIHIAGVEAVATYAMIFVA